MAVRTFLEAFCKYAIESTPGTANAVTTAPGIITGGNVQTPNNLETILGMGGQEQIRPGLLQPSASTTVRAQTKTLAQLAMRPSYPAGVLSSLTWGLGTADWGLQLTGAKINRLRGRGNIPSPLELTLDLMGLNYTEPVLSSGASLSGSVLMFFEAIVSLYTLALKARTVEVTVDNRCFAVAHHDGGTIGKLRQPDSIKEGKERVEARFELLLPDTATIFGDNPPTNLAASAKWADSSDGSFPNSTRFVTFTLSNLAKMTKEHPKGAGEGLVVYPVHLLGVDGSLALP